MYTAQSEDDDVAQKFIDMLEEDIKQIYKEYLKRPKFKSLENSAVRYLKLERRYQLRRRYRDTRYYRDTGVPYKKCRQISMV